MNLAVIGLGVQGRKRLAVAGQEVVATADPAIPEARFRAIDEVPVDRYEAACVCTPDAAKPPLLRYLLAHGKHVLVEKPLLADEAELRELEAVARERRVACYTAYNHRFEPQIARLKDLLASGRLGTLYHARLFYGNGTARDVKASGWRDQGMGVLSDLGSHLLDLARFLFADAEPRFESWSFNRFENRACDHVVFGSPGPPVLQLEASLMSWKNTFQIDVIGERGSAHLDGLCKWGPSALTVRTRVLPSGRPQEERDTISGPDPTWAAEYQHFKQLCGQGVTDLARDRWINRTLHALASAWSEATPV